jgi:methyl-accepting chemotaxis protein
VKIRPKVLLAFGVPTLLALVSSVVLVQALSRSLRTSDQVRHTQEVIADANKLVGAAIDAETGERGFVIAGDDAFLEPYVAGNATFDRTARELQALVADNPAQVVRVEQMIQLHQQWVGQAATPEIAARRTDGVTAAARLIRAGTGKDLQDQLRRVGAEFLATAQGLLQTRSATSDAAARSARVFTLLGFGLVVLVGLGIGLGLARRLSASAQAVTRAARALAAGQTDARAEVASSDEIGELAEVFNAMAEQLVAAAQAEREASQSLQTAVEEYSTFAERVAAGDLTAGVAANGSQQLQVLSQNLNGMASGLAELSSQVREGVVQIGSGTSQILAGVSQHTSTASEQAAAISEVSSTVQEVRAASEQTARKAREVADRAQASVEVSERGSQSVAAITAAMEQIRERVDAIARDILALSEQSLQIQEIIATVNDLADQSNILALNASIEAAKAGEHGRGFAVVASEVRNLAEQSKQATGQVRAILSEVQQATTGAVLATEQGTKVVEEGQRLAVHAGQAIQSQAGTIREAAHAAEQIAASAHEQSVGMDQVALAMTDLSESTTLFVAGARQSEEAAADLNRLAQQLTSVTGRYRV